MKNDRSDLAVLGGSPAYPACHRREPYGTLPRWREAELPHMEGAAARVLLLSTGTAIGESAIDTIDAIVRMATSCGRALAHKLVLSLV